MTPKTELRKERKYEIRISITVTSSQEITPYLLEDALRKKIPGLVESSILLSVERGKLSKPDRCDVDQVKIIPV
jgi:hypothetical protein